jgi:hypothetical protein
MSDHKALDNVVEQNRLSIGEFCRPNDILWIEGQQAAAELEQLKAENKELGTANVNFANQVIQLLTEQTQLRAERDGMRAQFEYIKKWASQDCLLSEPWQVTDAVIRMCDDVLAKYPAHPETKEEK